MHIQYRRHCGKRDRIVIALYCKYYNAEIAFFKCVEKLYFNSIGAGSGVKSFSRLADMVPLASN